MGAAVTDMLLERGLAFYAVTIIVTGKAKAYTVEGGQVSVRVSKGELIEALAAPLRAGRLKVGHDCVGDRPLPKSFPPSGANRTPGQPTYASSTIVPPTRTT